MQKSLLCLKYASYRCPPDSSIRFSFHTVPNATFTTSPVSSVWPSGWVNLPIVPGSNMENMLPKSCPPKRTVISAWISPPINRQDEGGDLPCSLFSRLSPMLLSSFGPILQSAQLSWLCHSQQSFSSSSNHCTTCVCCAHESYVCNWHNDYHTHSSSDNV